MKRRVRVAAVKKVVLKPVTFETAMGWLRRGKAIRRRVWHHVSRIFRVGPDVFVQLPGNEPGMNTLAVYKRAPDIWRPYPQDFLATDWEQVKA